MYQIYSCILVTLGICIVTLADAGLPKQCCAGINIHAATANIPAVVSDGIDFNWCIGILMLCGALFLSAYLGHEQDTLYRTFGKVWKGRSDYRNI
jgi:hypothetical protein